MTPIERFETPEQAAAFLRELDDQRRADAAVPMPAHLVAFECYSDVVAAQRRRGTSTGPALEQA